MTSKHNLSIFAALTVATSLTWGSVAAEDKARKKAPRVEQEKPAEKAVEAEKPADKPASAPAREAAPVPSDDAELAKIEQDLATVMDELVAARTRANVLSRSLFHTELTVSAQRRSDAQNLTHVVLRLDGVPVHESDGSALSQGRTQLFTGFVTPGRHELAIELTEASRDDPSYGYTRNERYRVEVKKDRHSRVELSLRDDSDMAEEALEGDEGEYQVETRVRVTSERKPD